MGMAHLPLANQRGAALILVVMVLALLTLLGMAITSTGLVEIDIARNEKVHEMAFYNAESGWQYGASWIDSHRFGTIEDVGSVATNDFPAAFSAAKYAAPEATAGQFAVAIDYRDATYAPLWGSEYRRFHYTLTSTGTAPTGAVSRVEARSGKIFETEGY